jgi:Tfp pilus assembly protein PilN
MEFNQINLTTHDHVDRRIIYAVLGGVALLLAAFTLINGIQWISKYSERSRYQAKISDLQQQASALSAAWDDKPPFKPEAALALQKSSRQANYLIALDIFPWIDILDEVEKTMPPEIVLDRFIPATDLKTIRITGHTPSVEPLMRFQDSLGKSDFFQSVVLENMDFGTGSSIRKGTAGNGAMQFEMICGLNLQAVFPEASHGDLWMTMVSATTGNVRKR